MSSQKGNAQRKRPQKHQNKFSFKNNLHDKTEQTKQMNSLELSGLCQRCKEIIDWKIKYKKYKPLKQAKKCTKCSQKSIKQAYYVICISCGSSSNVCCKCLENKDVIQRPGLSTAEQMSQDQQFEQELKMLPERKRRTFYRLQASGQLTAEKLKLLAADIDEFDDDEFDSDEIDDGTDEDDPDDEKFLKSVGDRNEDSVIERQSDHRLLNGNAEIVTRDDGDSQTEYLEEVQSKLKVCDVK